MHNTRYVDRSLAGLLILALVLALQPWLGTPVRAEPLAQAGSLAVFINEIHYDNSDTDAGEAIEIAGPAGTDLAGWSLVLYNGNGGAAYNTTALGGTIPDQQNGYGTLAFSYPVNGIQNGSPDGIALVQGETVVQFLSYEGSFTAVGGPADGMASTDIGVAEGSATPLGDSLQLVGTGTTYEDMTWSGPMPNTLGNVNTGQTFSAGGGPDLTSIHDIQFTEDASGDSPYAGETVTTRGIVTAFFYAGGGRYTFIQDGTGPWSGLLLYRPDAFVNVGDLLEVEGTVSEYSGLTEIAYGAATVLSTGNPLPAAQVLASGAAAEEQWESVLLRVENVTVTDADLGYGEWLVDDGSGGLRVDDLGSYGYTPGDGDRLDYVQGPLYYAYGDFKLEPRSDDDIGLAPPLVPICQIQGSGFASPYAGQVVRTQGVVFADLDQTDGRGFFIQDENCDGDPATSDGLFVYKGNRTDVVSAGDLVEVRGRVAEYYELTELNTSLSGITVLSGGNPLPAPVELNPPFDNAASRVYLESLEGMYVGMEDAAVVGPTNAYDETWVVRKDLGIDRVFQDDPAGSGEMVGVDDGGLFEIEPEAKVGDRVLGLQGALDYTFGAYKMQLVVAPTLDAAPDPPKYGDADEDGDVDLADKAFIQARLNETVPPAPAAADLNNDGRITGQDMAAFENLWQELALSPVEFTVATFNLENLFDTVDEPGKDDPAVAADEYALKLDKLAEAIHDGLREPTILGVEEAENLTVLQDLAARPEIEAAYEAVLVDGPDGRGIDVGLLYQADRATVLSYEARQGCTALVDGLGPDGNRDVLNPQNDATCDTNGDGVLDGNRLFSRPPLAVHLAVRSASGGQGEARTQELWVIVNHWKSKSEDTSEIQYTLPRRIEQAQFVAALVQEIVAAQPGADVIVLGDLNDFMDSQPLAALTGAGLRDLLFEVPRAQRYTYLYDGESEVLDHVLISADLGQEVETIQPIHIDADYPAFYASVPDTARQASDHDPVLLRLRLGR
jgi:predicted extracellular nuclease